MTDSINSRSCPRSEVLAAFLREELAPADQQAVDAHVSGCPLCVSAIQQLDEAGDEPFRELCAELPGAGERSVPEELGGHESDSHESCYRRMMAVAVQAFLARPDAGEVAPPERLGQYESLTPLGRGGMGVVYRARHARLKKCVALKLLPRGRLADGRALARFEREMEVVGRLDHPNIVRATDAGEAEGFHFLVMELVEGLDLHRLLRRLGPLPAGVACELVRQAAVGLQHAHENGLVHRDVKPSNLMLSSSGQVKILDLGLALLRGEVTALSASGQVMGTADYMAPEQWESSHGVDIRADVYSLGCTLFTLLTGSPPFASPRFATLYQKLKAHHEVPAPPVSRLCRNVPAEVDAIVARMLQKDPAQRPQLPADVARQIAPFCSAAELAPLLGNLRAEAALLAQGGVETKTHQEQPTGGHATTVAEHPARRRMAVRIGLACFGLAAVCFGVWLWGGWRPGGRADQSGSPPTAPTPEPQLPSGDPPPRDFKPGEWCELLDRPPRVWHWEGKEKSDLNHFDPALRRLNVNCAGAALLEVGEVNRERYDLEATFVQTPWVGHVGVFFRGRKDGETQGQTRVVADVVALDVLTNLVPDNPVQLLYGEVREFIHPPRSTVTQFLPPPGLIRYPTGEAQQLLVRVGPEGVEEVRWKGEVVDGIGRAAPGLRRRAGARGTAGIWIQHCSAQFQSIRVLLNPPPGDLK